MSYKDSFLLGYLPKNEQEQIRKNIEDKYKLFIKDFGKTLFDKKDEKS